MTSRTLKTKIQLGEQYDVFWFEELRNKVNDLEDQLDAQRVKDDRFSGLLATIQLEQDRQRRTLQQVQESLSRIEGYLSTRRD